MKKLKILSLLPALILCSCGAKKSKYAGTYQFRLGKSDGNHMEVTAVLTDDNDPKYEGYKVMTLSADLGDQLDIMKNLEELEDLIDDLVDSLRSSTDDVDPEIIDDLDDEIELLPKFIKALKEEIQHIENIKFFYKVSSYKNAKYGERLELGTHAVADIFDSIVSKDAEFAQIVDLIKTVATITGLFSDDLWIMPEKSKYAFNAFVNKKTLTFQVPISKEDLTHQFIWYGLEPNFLMDEPLIDYMDKMPGVKGEDRFGTHPAKEIKNNVVVKDEAAEVNKTFAYEFSNSPLYDAVDSENVISKFVLDSTGDKPKLYMAFDGQFEAGVYAGKVKIGESLKDIALTIDDKGLCQVEHNGKTGLKEGFFDNNQQEFRFRDVVKDPFEFRDFNIVDVGLSKIEA